MNNNQKKIKRSFDLVLSFILLLAFGGVIIIAAIIAFFDTRKNGFFKQKRVGQHGKLFWIYKIRSMKNISGVTTSVTTDSDVRISKLGRVWRKTKIDELPQLYNVLLGKMSFVGPRPDVPGYADKLIGDDRIILTIKPGITGPASIFYRNEEELLAAQNDPEKYNRDVIYPHKVSINKEYIKNYSFSKDFKYIYKTIF